MTTDLLEIDAAAVDFWEAGAEDEDDVYRCGCADCRALRRRAPARGREGETGDG